MVVGFACAMGVDMGFNEHHHEAEAEFFVHTKGHPQHLEVVAHQHAHSDSDGKNNCCNDEVLKIVRADKVVPQVVKQLNPVFSTAFIITYPDTIILPASQVSKSNKYFVCGYHPPIPDGHSSCYSEFSNMISFYVCSMIKAYLCPYLFC